MEMLLTIARIILLPVALGVLLDQFLHPQMAAVRSLFPLLSVAAIVIIIAIVVALNRVQSGLLAPALVATVMLHNLTGLFGGYWLARWLGRDERECRTLAIEVGMQNSGLAVALAVKYFSATAALPGALFSVWHNLSGALLAGFWGRSSARL